MENQFDNMALQLFVDPNEGGRAYARGIEKAFDSVGNAVGGILQSYNDRRVKNEAALGQLVANDPDGIMSSQAGMFALKPKEQGQLLKDYYSETYPSLSDKDGVLTKYVTDKQNQLDKIDLETKQANLSLKQREVQAAEDYSKSLDDMLANFDTSVNFRTGDPTKSVASLQKMKMLVAANPSHPKSIELAGRITQTEADPSFKNQMLINAARAEDAMTAFDRGTVLSRKFAPFVDEGRIERIDLDALNEERLSGNLGKQSKLLQMYEFFDGVERELAGTGNPMLKLNEIGISNPRNYLNGIADGTFNPETINPETLAADIDNYRQYVEEVAAPEPAQLTDIKEMFVLMEATSRFKGESSDLEQDQRIALESQVNSINGLTDLMGLITGNTADSVPEEASFMGKAIKTGPILAKLNGLAKYLGSGEDIAVLKNEINKLVPDIARGIFGEKGVLTDTDARRYAEMIADPSRPVDFNKIIVSMLTDTIRERVKVTVRNYAGQGKNLSGLIPTVSKLFETKVATPGQMVEMIRNGEIAVGSRYNVPMIDSKTGVPRIGQFELLNARSAMANLKQFQAQLDSYTVAAKSDAELNQNLAAAQETLNKGLNYKAGSGFYDYSSPNEYEVKATERMNWPDIEQRKEKQAQIRSRLFSPPPAGLRLNLKGN